MLHITLAEPKIPPRQYKGEGVCRECGCFTLDVATHSCYSNPHLLEYRLPNVNEDDSKYVEHGPWKGY